MKIRTVGEAPLQSIHSSQKLRMISIYKCRKTIMLLQIDTLGCQQKEMGHKGGQR